MIHSIGPVLRMTAVQTFPSWHNTHFTLSLLSSSPHHRRRNLKNRRKLNWDPESKFPVCLFLVQPDADIRLSGHVSWVGTTSIEITVWLDQFIHGTWQRITSAVFLMASRNSTISGPAPVNPLQPETDSEKAIFDGGEGNEIEY